MWYFQSDKSKILPGKWSRKIRTFRIYIAINKVPVERCHYYRYLKLPLTYATLEGRFLLRRVSSKPNQHLVGRIMNGPPSWNSVLPSLYSLLVCYNLKREKTSLCFPMKYPHLPHPCSLFFRFWMRKKVNREIGRNIDNSPVNRYEPPNTHNTT